MDDEKKILMSAQFAQQRGRMIENIYSTIADPDNWRTVISELAATTDSRSARLLVMNADATHVSSSFKHNIDENYHRQYVEHYVNACPWRPEMRQKRPGRFYSSYLHFSCPQPNFYHTEFYNDWAGPQDIHHGAAGTVYQDSGQAVQLMVQRTQRQGHYTETDTAFLNELVPHLQQAFQLARQVEDSHARAQAIEIAAGAEILPFILLDYALRPIHCTSVAEALINAESTLVLTKERLRLSDREHDQRLQRLLRTCLAAADSRTFQTTGGTLAVPRAQGANLHLRVKPVHPDVPLWSGRPAGYVAVYVYDPEAGISIDREGLSELYALSKAEIRVAIEILATPDPAEVARRCFISLHTVRSHLKAIFAKTAVNNQAELVKLLLAGSVRQR
ncbi:helix-turn-helix transcriptional regulator [Geopsychrobacter electrodiphilus]|uniref:helix-turn-helix transcriptional regulator n=1 Tax=Geopsychrobacter electrodiphilus TaxID=225196 RepID=UPI000382668F|nr:helix-turn-helix transcriptional regulator [Geopsychrobacter electrodiphilus]